MWESLEKGRWEIRRLWGSCRRVHRCGLPCVIKYLKLRKEKNMVVILGPGKWISTLDLFQERKDGCSETPLAWDFWGQMETLEEASALQPFPSSAGPSLFWGVEGKLAPVFWPLGGIQREWGGSEGPEIMEALPAIKRGWGDGISYAKQVVLNLWTI